MLDQLGRPVHLEIDGGLHPGNIRENVLAGADMVVVGNAVYGRPDPGCRAAGTPAMRCVVVLSGDIRDDRTARSLLDAADLVICADGGARHLKRLGRLPDLLVGDMDSAAPADLQWIVDRQVPVDRHPAEKDETDAELALLAAINGCRSPGTRAGRAGAFGNRPDHVLANQLLAARLAAQGWRLLLTDGVSRLHTLVGGQVLHLDLPPQAGSAGFCRRYRSRLRQPG